MKLLNADTLARVTFISSASYLVARWSLGSQEREKSSIATHRAAIVALSAVAASFAQRSSSALVRAEGYSLLAGSLINAVRWGGPTNLAADLCLTVCSAATILFAHTGLLAAKSNRLMPAIGMSMHGQFVPSLTLGSGE